MNRTAKQKCFWLGTAQENKTHFVAISGKKPKPGPFTITFKSFHLIQLKDLDSLYQTAKRALLDADQPQKRKK